MQDKNIIITNPERLKSIKQQMIADGIEKLMVVSDFDKTLTSCFVDGQKIVSLISILRDEHYLTPGYAEKAQEFYDKYHPIEIDPNFPLEEKKQKMHEWWSSHYKLLIDSDLKKEDLRKVAESGKTILRKGYLDFFGIINLYKIPLVILSATGAGSETINMYLKRFIRIYKNVYIASNEFIWDKQGKAIGVKQPIVHVFDKDFTVVKDFSFYNEIKNNKNVVLLGDGLSDAMMLNGFEYDNVIKIGFLNENVEGQLEAFKNIYDIIILNDGPMDFVNILLKELVKK